MYADYGQSNYGTMDAEAIDPLPLPENAPEQIDEVCLSLDIHLVCFDQMKIVFTISPYKYNALHLFLIMILIGRCRSSAERRKIENHKN